MPLIDMYSDLKGIIMATSSLATSIILSSSAQSQLTQLKAVNSVKLNKLNAQKTDITAKETASDKLDSVADTFKSSISAVRLSTNATDKAAAAKSLVSNFNALQTALTNATAKGATLYGASELRYAKSDLRSSFLDSSVLADLYDAGIKTTKDGLSISDTASGDLDTDTLNKLADAVTKMQTTLDNMNNNYDTKLANLDSQISRESDRVDRLNTVTTNKFLKMYQIMQQMSSSSSSSTTMSSILGG